MAVEPDEAPRRAQNLQRRETELRRRPTDVVRELSRTYEERERRNDHRAGGLRPREERGRPAGAGGWQSPSGSVPRSPRARAGRAGPSVRQVETSCPWPTAPAAACSRCSCGTTTTGQALVRTSVRPVEPSSSRLMLW